MCRPTRSPHPTTSTTPPAAANTGQLRPAAPRPLLRPRAADVPGGGTSAAPSGAALGPAPCAPPTRPVRSAGAARVSFRSPPGFLPLHLMASRATIAVATPCSTTTVSRSLWPPRPSRPLGRCGMRDHVRSQHAHRVPATTTTATIRPLRPACRDQSAPTTAPTICTTTSVFRHATASCPHHPLRLMRPPLRHSLHPSVPLRPRRVFCPPTCPSCGRQSCHLRDLQPPTASAPCRTSCGLTAPVCGHFGHSDHYDHAHCSRDLTTTTAMAVTASAAPLRAWPPSHLTTMAATTTTTATAPLRPPSCCLRDHGRSSPGQREPRVLCSGLHGDQGVHLLDASGRAGQGLRGRAASLVAAPAAPACVGGRRVHPVRRPMQEGGESLF